MKQAVQMLSHQKTFPQINQLEIVVENDEGDYQKKIIGLSNNISYVVEDVTSKDVDKYKYTINYNPKMWVPVTFENID